MASSEPKPKTKILHVMVLGLGAAGRSLLGQIVDGHADHRLEIRVTGGFSDDTLRQMSVDPAIREALVSVNIDDKATAKAFYIGKQLGSALVIADCSQDDRSCSALKSFLSYGCFVVLANQFPLVSDMSDFDELMKNQRRICFDSAIGAGLPLVEPIRLLLHGNGRRIRAIVGSANESLSFLMTEVESGSSFSKAVLAGQARGIIPSGKKMPTNRRKRSPSCTPENSSRHRGSSPSQDVGTKMSPTKTLKMTSASSSKIPGSPEPQLGANSPLSLSVPASPVQSVAPKSPTRTNATVMRPAMYHTWDRFVPKPVVRGVSNKWPVQTSVDVYGTTKGHGWRYTWNTQIVSRFFKRVWMEMELDRRGIQGPQRDTEEKNIIDKAYSWRREHYQRYKKPRYRCYTVNVCCYCTDGGRPGPIVHCIGCENMSHGECKNGKGSETNIGWYCDRCEEDAEKIVALKDSNI